MNRADYLQFYRKYYPFDAIFQWSNANSTTLPQHREYSFIFESKTIQTPANDQEYVPESKKLIFHRYRSFDTAYDLKNEVIRQVPIRFELGACYQRRPSKMHYRMGAREKEIVIDIDANDYDDIRMCACKGKKEVCTFCWLFIEAAMEAVETILSGYYGFKDTLWFFSGRRGVHCWISDMRAKCVPDQERAIVIGVFAPIEVRAGYYEDGKPDDPFVNIYAKQAGDRYADKFIEETYSEIISMIEGEDNAALQPLKHPRLSLEDYQRRLLKVYFDRVERLLATHEILSDKENRAKLLSFIQKRYYTRLVEESWAESESNNDETPSSLEYWRCLKAHLSETEEVSYYNILTWMMGPRIDADVTKSMKHLLKAPFNIHQETGKICVPIIDKKTFDPLTVPTLHQCIKNERLAPLKKYVDYFEEKIKSFGHKHANHTN